MEIIKNSNEVGCGTVGDGYSFMVNENIQGIQGCDGAVEIN